MEKQQLLHKFPSGMSSMSMNQWFGTFRKGERKITDLYVILLWEVLN